MFKAILACAAALAAVGCTSAPIDRADASAQSATDVSAARRRRVDASADAVIESSSDARGSGLQDVSPVSDSQTVDARDSAVDVRDAPSVVDASLANRPSGNTGIGFFTVGSRLYDANGVEFRVRGVNHLHWDAPGVGIPKSGANTERWDLDFSRDNSALMQRSITNRLVPMPSSWVGTCDTNAATLARIVDTWVAQAARFKPFERWMLINIANEWGAGSVPLGQSQGAGQASWRDAYVTAIGRLRAAGLNATLVIDAGGCGQAPGDIVDFASAVLQADPQRNIVFSIHVYGLWCVPGACQSWQQPLAAGFDALGALGVPIIVGEFGPGYGLNASTDTVPPTAVLQAAESHGFGWLAWAWDDPAGEYTSPQRCPPNDRVYALSCTGDYRSSADLTTFGRLVVEDPVVGLKVLARAASVF